MALKMNGKPNPAKPAEKKTPAAKTKKQETYKIRVTEAMIKRGYTTREAMEWECVNVEDGDMDCQLCGHKHIHYLFTVTNRKDGQTMIVGSECVGNINGINPDSAEYALMLFNKQYNEAKKARAEEKKAARLAEYQAKYAKEIAYLTVARKNNVYLPGLAFEAYLTLEHGKKDLTKEMLDAVHEMMNAAPKVKTQKELLIEACGGEEALEAMREYVNEKFAANQYNDFWANMKFNLNTKLFMSEKMVAAVKKCMDEDAAKVEKTQKLPEKPIEANVEIEIPAWLARHHECGKVLVGDIFIETPKAIYFKGHTQVKESKFCLRCGRELTHPVSLVIGIGPECCDKLHIPWTADNEAQIEAMKEAIRNVTFEGWLPKLKIQRMEVLEAGA